MSDHDKPRAAPPPPSADSSGPWPAEERASGSIPKLTGGLKVVTISPGNVSIPDIEEAPESYKPPPSKDDPYIGCTIDNRYKVEAMLGEGGMGIVYRCRHKIIGKLVAMKVLRADLARDAEVTERFLNEAKSASAIGNAHIIDISDFGQLPDGSTYFVMEFLDGTPLTDLIGDGMPVPVPRILHIALQLAEGLAAAHSANIVHRDLKPDNIFLIDRGADKDFIKILDFGIAKVSTGEGKLTRAGAVFGTPHYMSPEQAAGAPVDHRGDIYSLGVILYELASGKVPFDADNFMGILTQHMYKAPVPIRALVPQPQDVPPGLEAIVLKCLSKRPEQRYQSMSEVITDLDKLKDGLIPDAVPEMMNRSGGFNVPADYFKKGGASAMPAPVPAMPVGQPRVKSRWPVYAGIAGVLAAVAIVVGIFAQSSSSTAAAPSAEPVATTTAKPELDPTPEVAPTAEPAAPAEKSVIVAASPLEAHVFVADEDMGSSPVSVKVPEGKSVEVTVKSDGYKDKTLTIDGSEPKVAIQLERIVTRSWRPRPSTKPTPKPATKPQPKPKPSIGGGEIVNPWE